MRLATILAIVCSLVTADFPKGQLKPDKTEHGSAVSQQIERKVTPSSEQTSSEKRLRASLSLSNFFNEQGDQTLGSQAQALRELEGNATHLTPKDQEKLADRIGDLIRKSTRQEPGGKPILFECKLLMPSTGIMLGHLGANAVPALGVLVDELSQSVAAKTDEKLSPLCRRRAAQMKTIIIESILRIMVGIGSNSDEVIQKSLMDQIDETTLTINQLEKIQKLPNRGMLKPMENDALLRTRRVIEKILNAEDKPKGTPKKEPTVKANEGASLDD